MTLFPNLPRGVKAFLFEAAERRRNAEESVARALRAAGLSEIVLPVLDYASPYDGVTAEGDEHVYRFIDREGELLSLRADFTPMAARVLAPHLAAGEGPLAFFYRGDVVRDEPTGVGRPREFAQVGAERYGDPSFQADEAMLRLLLEALGEIPAGRLRLTLGYANLLERVLVSAAPELTLGDGHRLRAALVFGRERRVTALEDLLVKSGARPAAADGIARSLLVGFDPASELFGVVTLKAAAKELVRAAEVAKAARPGISVVVDLAGTPSAPYYTGLTVNVDVAGVAAPVAGGGRYDRLLARFGSDAAAVGFSVGVEALASALALPANLEEARRPLRIALGKGRLVAKALDALRAAGADFAEPDGRRLLLSDRSGAFELLLLKDDDVPTYVAHGGADLGVVGGDRVAESGESVFTPVEFPFGACRLSLIGRSGEPFSPNGRPVTVGTKYQRLAARFFDEKKIAYEVIPLAGSVELAAALRLTDVVVDLIETGSTMAANGLQEIEIILPSRATLIVGRPALVSRRDDVSALVDRLRAAQGVSC